MKMKQKSRGERFIAAFNDIEDEFRRVLGRARHTPFARMARMHADRQHLPPAQLDALLSFAALRNAISHGRFHDDQPIAEPVAAVAATDRMARFDRHRQPRSARALGGFLAQWPQARADHAS